MGKTQVSEHQRFITPEFRTSYAHVFKAQSLEGSKPKYSVTMLLKKSSDLSKFKLAMKHAKIEAFGPDKARWPDEISSPVTDGDVPDKKGVIKEGYKGHYAIKATSREDVKPGVVDREGEPILEAAQFYSGCYARAQVFARVWEFPKGSGTYGVQFILDHVQKIRDGKPFGNRKSATEVFAPISDIGSGDSDDDSDEDTDF